MSPSKRQMMLKNFCLPSGQNEKWFVLVKVKWMYFSCLN
jgi:hypothetical protein